MKTQIVKIGNSQGIRIPKIILEQSGLGTDVEIVAEHEQIVIRSIKKTRAGWDDAFKVMAKNHDDELLDADSLETQSSWDEKEWEWE